MAGGPHRPSLPSMSEPSLRRLGVGGGGGGDRPLRAQLVVALTAGLILIAVPLYLWRRPSGSENAPKDGGAPAAGSATLDAAAYAPPSPDAAPKKERVRLGSVQRVKCSASAGARGQEGNLCDRLPIFEEALSRAIRENVDCAPKTGKEGTINYVLSVDFRRRRLRVYPGKSGQWKGPQAKRSAKCVHRAMPATQWDAIRHQYNYYLIAILATYPSPEATFDPKVPPSFE